MKLPTRRPRPLTSDDLLPGAEEPYGALARFVVAVMCDVARAEAATAGLPSDGRAAVMPPTTEVPT